MPSVPIALARKIKDASPIATSRKARCTREKRDLFRAVIVFSLPTSEMVLSSQTPTSSARRDKWKIVTLPVVTPTHNNREAIHFDFTERRGEGGGRGEETRRERLRNRRAVLPFPIHRNIFSHSPPTHLSYIAGSFFTREPPR